MAGLGKRMRPHTLTIPKPLIPLAGKSIVHRLAENLIKISKQSVDEIAFIIGDFGKEVQENLLKIAEDLGVKGSIYSQDEPLGTGHAILSAKEVLEGNVIIAFADTLFIADFTLDTDADGIIWVHKVDDPKAFGVVKINENNIITDFVEKPETFVSDLAIIGIYYIKEGEKLKDELQYLIDNDIKDKGEYQLTNGLENLKQKGVNFVTQRVTEWLDCGNKDATVYANNRILEVEKNNELIAGSAEIVGTQIEPPCYIGEGVKIKDSVIGPHVSIGENTTLENVNIKNTIIQTHSEIKNCHVANSMIGNFVYYNGKRKENDEELSIGDYSVKK